MKNRSTLSRRDVLRGAAGVALLLPMLEACGRAGGEPKDLRLGSTQQKLTAGATRFFYYWTPHGVVPDQWYPVGSPNRWWAATQPGYADGPAATETNFALGGMLAPLEPHKSDLLLVKGLRPQSGLDDEPHTGMPAAVLTGVRPRGERTPSYWIIDSSGPSIDQVIASHFEASGIVLKKKSIQVGSPESAFIWASPTQPLGGTFDPAYLFNVLFDDPSASAVEIARRRSRRKSILDGTSAEYTALATKVSGEDRHRIQAHLEAVREVEKRVFVPSCDPAGYAVPATFAHNGERRRALLDITILAMACDSVRVASDMHLRVNGEGTTTFPFLGFPDDVHDLSHAIVGAGPDSIATQRMVAIHAWFAAEAAYFIGEMKKRVLPDGSTLFDHTVVMTSSDITYDHDVQDLPFLIVAGSKTGFKTGRFVNLPTTTPHNNLLVTVLKTFGIDGGTFGDPAYCTGNLDAALLA